MMPNPILRRFVVENLIMVVKCFDSSILTNNFTGSKILFGIFNHALHLESLIGNELKSCESKEFSCISFLPSFFFFFFSPSHEYSLKVFSWRKGNEVTS